MNKSWSDNAWEDYLYWQSQDRKMLRRINELLRDIERDPFKGRVNPNRSNMSGRVIGAAGSMIPTD